MLLYNPRQFGLYLFILSQIARTETSFSGSSRLADTRMYSRMYLSWSQRYPVHGLYFTYVAVVEQDFFICMYLLKQTLCIWWMMITYITLSTSYLERLQIQLYFHLPTKIFFLHAYFIWFVHFASVKRLHLAPTPVGPTCTIRVTCLTSISFFKTNASRFDLS
jgi:hypothetical protein